MNFLSFFLPCNKSYPVCGFFFHVEPDCPPGLLDVYSTVTSLQDLLLRGAPPSPHGVTLQMDLFFHINSAADMRSLHHCSSPRLKTDCLQRLLHNFKAPECLGDHPYQLFCCHSVFLAGLYCTPVSSLHFLSKWDSTSHNTSAGGVQGLENVIFIIFSHLWLFNSLFSEVFGVFLPLQCRRNMNMTHRRAHICF